MAYARRAAADDLLKRARASEQRRRFGVALGVNERLGIELPRYLVANGDRESF